MKLKSLLLVPMLILPTFMSAQGVSGQTKPDLKAPFDVMKGNVAKVNEAGEEERWQANIDLWQIMLGQAGAVAKADLEKMTALLDVMKCNVAKVTEAGEKERWQANIDLWQVLIGQKGVLTKDDANKFKAPFEKMKGNVAKVNEAGEKERWQASCDMWQVVIDRALGATGNTK